MAARGGVLSSPLPRWLGGWPGWLCPAAKWRPARARRRRRLCRGEARRHRAHATVRGHLRQARRTRERHRPRLHPHPVTAMVRESPNRNSTSRADPIAAGQPEEIASAPPSSPAMTPRSSRALCCQWMVATRRAYLTPAPSPLALRVECVSSPSVSCGASI